MQVNQRLPVAEVIEENRRMEWIGFGDEVRERGRIDKSAHVLRC